MRPCVKCGKQFTPEGNWYQRKGQITCTVQCRSLFERARVDAVVGKGIPLVTMMDDHCICNICGAKVTLPGRHLSGIHLLPLGKHLSLSERQVIYGFTQGSRCVPQAHSDMLRERGLRSENMARMSSLRALCRNETSGCPPHIVKAPRSSLQRDRIRMRKINLLAVESRKRDGNVTVACTICKTEFKVTRYVYKTKHTKTCSHECAATLRANLSRERGANLTSEQRAEMGSRISAARLAKSTIHERPCEVCNQIFRPAYAARRYCSKPCYDAMRSQVCGVKRKLADIDCAICGTTFRPKSSKIQCCSYACGMKLAIMNRYGRGVGSEMGRELTARR